MGSRERSACSSALIWSRRALEALLVDLQSQAPGTRVQGGKGTAFPACHCGKNCELGAMEMLSTRASCCLWESKPCGHRQRGTRRCLSCWAPGWTVTCALVESPCDTTCPPNPTGMQTASSAGMCAPAQYNVPFLLNHLEYLCPSKLLHRLPVCQLVVLCPRLLSAPCKGHQTLHQLSRGAGRPSQP